MGASFDVDLLEEIGRQMGEECRGKGVHVWLGPTLNIQVSIVVGALASPSLNHTKHRLQLAFASSVLHSAEGASNLSLKIRCSAGSSAQLSSEAANRKELQQRRSTLSAMIRSWTDIRVPLTSLRGH